MTSKKLKIECKARGRTHFYLKNPSFSSDPSLFFSFFLTTVTHWRSIIADVFQSWQSQKKKTDHRSCFLLPMAHAPSSFPPSFYKLISYTEKEIRCFFSKKYIYKKSGLFEKMGGTDYSRSGDGKFLFLVYPLLFPGHAHIFSFFVQSDLNVNNERNSPCVCFLYHHC